MGMKFMQKRMQRDAEAKEQAEQAKAARAAKWKVEQEGQQQQQLQQQQQQGKESVGGRGDKGSPQSTSHQQQQQRRVVVFEAEETDPKMQVLGRRAFGGFNDMVARMWEQNAQLLGLGKKKRKREDDVEEAEVDEREMVDRYQKHGQLPIKSGDRVSGGGGGGGGAGGGRGGGTRTSSQRRMGGVVEGEMVITNSRIRAIGIIGVRINSSGVKFACACIN